MINSNNKQDRKIEVIKMSYFSEYEDLIRDINEDIEAGVITADDWIKVVRKRKIKGVSLILLFCVLNFNIPYPTAFDKIQNSLFYFP